MNNRIGMLTGFRMLDLAGEAGFLCGKVFADLGADVLKVEPPGGDAARRRGPFAHDEPGPERSLYWAAFNAGKRSIVLDLTSPLGRDSFLQLARTADFVLESFQPGFMDGLGLGYEALRQTNPRIIFTSVTPFGREGPYRGFVAEEIVVSALGGVLYLVGDEDRAPIHTNYPFSVWGMTALDAAIGTLMAHYHREQTGIGQHVDVSAQESLVGLTLNAPLNWEINRFFLTRKGPAMQSARGGWPRRVHWPCKDGHVAFAVFPAPSAIESARNLAEWMRSEGSPTGAFGEADWKTMKFGALTQEMMQRLEGPVSAFFAHHTMAELYEEALQRRILLAPVATVKDVEESPQLKAIGYWRTVEDPGVGCVLQYPTFLQASQTSAGVRGPAPGVGEHNREVLSNLSQSLNRLNVSGDVRQANEAPPPRGALEGVKVIDFGRSLVGPTIGRYLALHGATVIRVESRHSNDLSRLSGPFKSGQEKENFSAGFSNLNWNKYGITLNLKHPIGKNLAKRLVSWSDVVIENSSIGAMDALGLGYGDLQKVNPGVIMVSSSSQGARGPHAHHPGWAVFMAALTAMSHLTGWPDRDPAYPMAPYPDFLPPRFAVIGILAALDYRRRTGQGQLLQLSQLESCVYLLAPLCFDYTVNNRIAERTGNRREWAAPHGVYRCKGEDRWCAIAVASEEQWKNFCQALSKQEWIDDPRFCSLAQRKRNEDALDRAVEGWTSQHAPEEVMVVLQRAGVPAGKVSNGRDLYEDPQLHYREHFLLADHPHLGRHSVEAASFRLSSTPAMLHMPGPDIGQHNEVVFCQMLGMPGEEFVDLLAQGVFE